MGKVIIVGAGIGSKDLITVKAKNVLEDAEVIIYDRLLNNSIISELGEYKELYYVGKKAADHFLTQDEINELMVQKAKEGKKVVRLKGGDPYVFGRGGEEVEFLIENGLDFEVVPGVTSGVVSLMYAGIPATHRDACTSVSFITGHRKTGVIGDFHEYAKLNGTLVFYMGLNNLKKITDDLLEGGMDGNKPAAVIMNGAYPNQRVFTSTVEKIAEEIKPLNFGSPSLIVIGEVVNYRDKLNFFETKELFGKTIVNTRALSQNSKLSKILLDLGANVIEAPTIEIHQVNKDLLIDKIKSLDYTHIVFNSVNAAEIFINEYLKIRDIRDLFNIKICVIGEKTREVFEKYGIRPEVMPNTYVGEELIDSIKPFVDKDSKVFLPHSSITRKVLLEELDKIVDLDQLVVYENTLPKEKVDLPNAIDYVLFTSSSTVSNFISMYGSEVLKKSKVISIGPITTQKLLDEGIPIYRESEKATIDSMVDTIKEDVL